MMMMMMMAMAMVTSTLAIVPPTNDWNLFVALCTTLSTTVIQRDDTGYATAVPMFVDLFRNRRPFAIVYAENAQAVAETVKFARRWSMGIAARSGGNSNLGWGTCDGDCLVVDLSRMNSILTSLPNATVRVGPGVTNRDVTEKVSVLGFAIPQGDCPMVCLGGYTVGGGLALSSRVLGLNIDAVIEMEVVDATGDIIVANAANAHSDLFWALRGGSGINFGIVTSLLFATKRIPPTMLGGYIAFPLEQTAALASVYYDTVFANWNDPAYDPFGFSLVFVVNDETGVPEIRLAGLWYDANLQKGQALLAPFSGLANASVHIEAGPFVALMQPMMNQYYGLYHTNWTMPDAMIAVPQNKSDFTTFLTTLASQARALPPNAWIAWVYAPMGGAVNRVARNATAFPHRSSGGNLHMPTLWYSPMAEATTRAYGQTSLAATRAWWSQLRSNPSSADPPSYVNHPSEYLRDWQKAYWDENFPRLAQVKSKYDPNNFLHNGQGILL